MEKGAVGGGDDPARAVGMCDRLLTFLAKNLTMNRQNITEGPRNGGSGSGNGSNDQKTHHAGEEDDDEFAVKIEKTEFELSHEEEEGGHRSFTATILEETSTDILRASDRQKEAMAEAAREAAAAAAAAAAATATAGAGAAQGEKKVRKSVTIKEEAAGGKVDKKPSQVKKRQASSSGGQQVGTGGGPEEQKPAPPRWGLRPRMPSILRVPSNINEKSATFIQERKRGFVGAAGKPEK